MRKVHTFAVPPNMVAPLLALLAIGVAAAILYGYLVILVIIVAYVIHIPFAVRNQRWLAEAPGGVGRQAQGSSARRGARSAGPSRTAGRWRGWGCASPPGR